MTGKVWELFTYGDYNAIEFVHDQEFVDVVSDEDRQKICLVHAMNWLSRNGENRTITRIESHYSNRTMWFEYRLSNTDNPVVYIVPEIVTL